MLDPKKKWTVGRLDRFHGHYSYAVMNKKEKTGDELDVIKCPTFEIAQQIVNDHNKTLSTETRLANRLLKQAADTLCADSDSPFFGQGDYCRCGAYVGRGDKHKTGCLYVKIKKFLKDA